MEVNFSKMHGFGNSFVVILDLSCTLEKLVKNCGMGGFFQLSQKICDQNWGIGADGLVLLQPAHDHSHDFSILHYNPDGSLAQICGNALRCCHFFATLKKLMISSQKKEVFNFLTGAGIRSTKTINTPKHNENSATVEATMGELPQKMEMIRVQGREYCSVSLGNPHAVCFVKDFKFDYKKSAEKLKCDQSLFPESVNVEYAQIKNLNEIDVKVIERGVGETLCCGSGACAVAAVGILQKHNKIDINQKIKINLPGGTLGISVKNKQLIMQGEACLVAEGKYFL